MRFQIALLVVVMSLFIVSALGGCAPAATPSVPPTIAPSISPPTSALQPTAVPTVAAPTMAAAPTKAASAGKIVVAVGQDVTTLDPSLLSDMISDSYTTLIFDELVQRDPKTLKPVPQLAESWELVNDTTWRFHLRKGVTFQNKEPFNADSVKFTLDRVRDPKVASSGAWAISTIKDVVKVDDYTVNIITSAPDPIVPQRLSFMSAKMLPPQYFQKVGAEEFAKRPIGTGPWKFIERVPNDHLTVEANPDYWQGAPNIQQITYKVVPEAASRLAMLLTGEADVANELSPDQAQSLKANSNLRLEALQSMIVMYASLNGLDKKGPLADVRVRQAINYAVDKESIVKNVLRGFGETKINAIGPTFECFNAKLAGPYPYDPVKARKLIADAGYANGFSVRLIGPTTGYTANREVMQAIAGYLKDVGVSVDVQLMEWGNYVSLNMAKDTVGAMVIVGWGGSGLFVPDLVFMPLFGSDSQWSTYSNPKVDDLMKQASSATDPARRCELWNQVQQITVDEAGRLILWEQFDLYGVNNQLEWTPTSDQVMNFYRAKLKPR